MAYIHHLLLHQIPEHIRESYPVFCTFMDHYYRWLSTHGFRNLEEITSIDYVNEVLDLTDRSIRLQISPLAGTLGRLYPGCIVSVTGGKFDDLNKIAVAKVFSVYEENAKTYVSLVGVDTSKLKEGYVSITDLDIDITDGCILTKGELGQTSGGDYDYNYIKLDPNRDSKTAEYFDFGELSNHPLNYINANYFESLTVDNGESLSRIGSNRTDTAGKFPYGDVLIFDDLTIENGTYTILPNQTVIVQGKLYIGTKGTLNALDGSTLVAKSFNSAGKFGKQGTVKTYTGETEYENFVKEVRPGAVEIDHTNCKFDNYGLLKDVGIVPQDQIQFTSSQYRVDDSTPLDLIGFYIIGTSGAKAQVVSRDDQGRSIIRYITADAKFSDGELIYVENGSVNHPENIHSLCEIDYAKYTDLARISSVRTVPSVFIDSFSQMLDTEQIFDTNNDAIALILKNIRSLYLSKGTDEAIKYMIKATQGVDSDVRYPWENVLKPSDGKWTQQYAVQFKTAKNSAGDFIGQFPESSDAVYEMEFSIENDSTGSVEVFEFNASDVERFVVSEGTDHSDPEVVYRVYFDFCPKTYIEDRAGNPQTVRIRGVDERGKPYLLWQGYTIPVPTGLEVIEENRWDNVSNREVLTRYDGARWQEGQLLIHGGQIGGIRTDSTAYDTVSNPYWKRDGELPPSAGYLYRIECDDLSALGKDDVYDVVDGFGISIRTADIKIESLTVAGETFRDVNFTREGESNIFKVYLSGVSDNGVSADAIFDDGTDFTHLSEPCVIEYSFGEIAESIDGNVVVETITDLGYGVADAEMVSGSQEYGISSVVTYAEDYHAPLIAKVVGTSEKTDALTAKLKEKYGKTDADIYNMSQITYGCKSLELISLGHYIDPEGEVEFESLPLFTDHPLWLLNIVPATEDANTAELIGKTIYVNREIDGEVRRVYATILYCDRKNTFAIHYITPIDSDSLLREGESIYISGKDNDDPAKTSVGTVGFLMSTDFMRVKYRLTFGSSVLVNGRWEDNSSLLDESTIVLQDSNYYQQFSYDIVSTADPTRYEGMIDHFHPAGTKRFTTYVLESNLSLKNKLGIHSSFAEAAISFYDIIHVTDIIAKHLIKPINDYLYVYDDRMVDHEGRARDALVKFVIKALMDDVILTETKFVKDLIKGLPMEYIHVIESIPSRIFTLAFVDDPKDGTDRAGDLVLMIDGGRSTTDPLEIQDNIRWQKATFGKQLYTISLDALRFDLTKDQMNDVAIVDDSSIAFDRDFSLNESVFVNEEIAKDSTMSDNRWNAETVLLSLNPDDMTSLKKHQNPSWDEISNPDDMYPEDGYFEREYVQDGKYLTFTNVSYEDLTYTINAEIDNTKANNG